MRERDRKIKQTGPVRKLGSTDMCEVCGNTYTVTCGLQKYCPGCAKDAVRAIDRVQSLEYYHRNKEQINHVRNQRRRKTNVCVICGKEFLANGKCTNTCSPECHAIIKKEWQRKADKKRNRNKKTGCS